MKDLKTTADLIAYAASIYQEGKLAMGEIRFVWTSEDIDLMAELIDEDIVSGIQQTPTGVSSKLTDNGCGLVVKHLEQIDPTSPLATANPTLEDLKRLVRRMSYPTSPESYLRTLEMLFMKRKK